MRLDEFQIKLIEVEAEDCLSYGIDIEVFLADILIDYWLKNNKSSKKASDGGANIRT